MSYKHIAGLTPQKRAFGASIDNMLEKISQQDDEESNEPQDHHGYISSQRSLRSSKRQKQTQEDPKFSQQA